MNTLADSLIDEISRVRDKIMPAYLSIGKAGEPALYIMRIEMDAAMRALAFQDVAMCMKMLKALQGYKP